MAFSVKRGAFIIATVVTTMLPAVALPDHTEPLKAKTFRFDLVNAFIPCDQSNTNTQSGDASACAPAVPRSPCSFSSTGSGRLTAMVTGSPANGDQDIKLTVVVKGLTEACEFENLHISLSFRMTTDDCPEGSCTTGDFLHYLLPPFCIVTNGVCKIKTTLVTAFGGAPPFPMNGKNTGITLSGCGLQPFGSGFEDFLECGILLK